MKHDYLTNIPLDKARADYIEFLKSSGMKGGEETVSVSCALDRICARAVYAKICSPHYNASAMDGIALKASLTFGASETTPVHLADEDFIRLDTGDPLPEGCDAVVMIEDVVEDERGGILLYSPAAPWQHIRQIGEDICAGDMILPSYSEITPAAMGAMLAGGVLEVAVTKRPVIGILPTGDEIVPSSASPKAGDVLEFNSTIFSGMLEKWGAVPMVLPIVKDKREDIKASIEKALQSCDGLLICAGTSAGRDDYTTTILRELGEVYYHGIAIKPGKPAVLARIGTKPVLGVPGYPVSGIIVLEQLFKDVVFELLHRPAQAAPKAAATLSKRINSSLKYREFVRARLSPSENGLVAVPLNRGAGVVTSFVKADALIDIPQDSEGIAEGGKISVNLLRPLSQIENTLSIIGSHDPLLDEAADILRRTDRNLSVASSHVGSMGGVFAVKRGEAMLAGVHLLDPETGEYNKSYIRRYFPENDAVLLRCVGRTQGLMVAAENPLGIKAFADIAGLRYVNRQGGSGTRILCDHLIKQGGMDAQKINGYTREEFTHTAVAAQIASGTADAGLGIYSAAKLYGLDFIPVCTEKYDLLTKRAYLQNPTLQRFLGVLRSEEFRARLTALGGYTLEAPGEEISL